MSCIPLKKEFMTFMFLVGSATIIVLYIRGVCNKFEDTSTLHTRGVQ